MQMRLTFYVYVLSRWYVFSIFNLFHLQYDKVLGLSFRDTWHTHITPGRGEVHNREEGEIGAKM